MCGLCVGGFPFSAFFSKYVAVFGFLGRLLTFFYFTLFFPNPSGNPGWTFLRFILIIYQVVIIQKPVRVICKAFSSLYLRRDELDRLLRLRFDYWRLVDFVTKSAMQKPVST
jgi:hypothetical protein